ncbi:hypothetical protein CHS0354_010722 [Potamilus streckersoni]|uniref:COR domain-containing protein n=1 Tax=Potamilus streckersoni TaxID=2493646 RepID=A0AAE0W348_9BIVA|nr:hypothetical protein CHS0354_010722 [Potamilus streckersoni]
MYKFTLQNLYKALMTLVQIKTTPFLQSDQLFRLQRLVKLLTGQAERPEDTGQQKGHTEVINQEVVYPRETTPGELHGPAICSDSNNDDTSADIEGIYKNNLGHSSESDIDEVLEDTSDDIGFIYRNDLSDISESNIDEVVEDTSDDTVVVYRNDLSEFSDSDIDEAAEEKSVTIQERGRKITIDQEVDITKTQPQGSSSVKRRPDLKTSGTTFQESNRPVTNKDNAMMEFLQMVNEKADKLEKNIVDYAALAMWDFAGQYIFYTTHQTFLTCHAIYLLVTDLSQLVTDLVEDDECFFDTEGVKLCKVQDLVEVWMNSIHCCSPSPIAKTPVTSPTSDITMTSPAFTSHGACSTIIPPAILVGTHVDTIRQDKRQEVIRKYFDHICLILKDKPAFQHLVDFFPIDNTQFDPQLEALKKRIFELASMMPSWGQELPANWLALEASLMKLKTSGIKVIPHSLVEEMNLAGAFPIRTTEQLDLFLRFQHETGNFIYFSVEGLREWLVLDTAWLIDALKSLISADTFSFKNNPAIQSKLLEFRKKGKLAAELIDAIWTKGKHPEFHYYKEIILQLMEKLNMLARPRYYDPDADEAKVEDYFLAPSMIRQATPNEFLTFGPNSQQGNTSVICFVFMGKILPSPIFHRLVTACVAQWSLSRKNMENLIFCGCSLFELDRHHRMTLLFKEHVIFAGITKIGSTDKTLSSKLCIEVREFITSTLSSITGCLGQNLPFELSILCPKSDRYNVHCLIPVTILKRNADVLCNFHDNSHVIISRDVLRLWFQ